MAHGPQADNTRHPGALFNLMLSSVTSAVNQNVPWLYVTSQASCWCAMCCIYLDYCGKFLNSLALPPFPSPFQRVSSRHDIIIADMVTCPSVSINTSALTWPFVLQRIKQCRLRILLRWLALTLFSCLHLNVPSLAHKFTEKNHRLQKNIPSGERFPSCSLNDPYS